MALPAVRPVKSTEDTEGALLDRVFFALSDPVRRAMAALSRQLARSADGFGQEADRGGQLGLGREGEPQQEGRG